MRRVGAALGAALIAAAATAQTIALGATMPPGGIAFGDVFELYVDRTASSVHGEPDPIDERTFAPLVVEPLGQEIIAGGAGHPWTPMTVRLRFRARCFAAGEVKLGPLTQRWRAADREAIATSGQLVLNVRSSLPEPAGAFEWPGDVREMPSPARWPWLAAAAAALLGGVLWWRRPRAAAVIVPIEAPPEPTALRDLRALRVPGDDADAAAVVAFVTDVKRLLRQHCRERFAVAADVCTSEELQRHVPPSERLAGCLRACDLALFGAVLPPAADRERMLVAAIAFAEGAP